MKVKVKRYFADAYTGKRYASGDTYAGPPERVAELRGSGHLTKQDMPDPEPEPAAETPAPRRGRTPAPETP